MVDKKITKRVGSLIGLKSGYREQYLILHKNVFPGVLERLKKSHVNNYSIFLSNLILFSYMEYTGCDYSNDMAALGDPVTKEWWKLTDPMQKPFSYRKEGEWWAAMECLHRFKGTQDYDKDIMRYASTAEVKRRSENTVRNLFENFNELLGTFYVKAGISNLNIYFLKGKLYVYFEHYGNDFTVDEMKLNSEVEIKKFNLELGKNLKTPWQEMKEVFHLE